MTRRRFGLRKTEHDHVHDRLSAYVDDELLARERSRVEAHLRTCVVCQTDLRELRWTKSVLQQAPAVELPRSFVLRQVDVAPYQAKRRRLGFGAGWAMQWATVAVALIFVLVLAGDLISGRLLLGSPAPGETMMLTERVEVTVKAEQEIVVEEQPLAAAPAPVAEEPDSLPTPSPAPPVAAEAPREEDTQAGVMNVVTETMKAAPLAAQEGSLEVTSTLTSTEPSADRAAFSGPAEGEETQEPVGQQELQPTPRRGDGLRPGEDQAPPQQEDRALRSRPWFMPLALQSGWRIAEVILGLVLVGLVIAIIWTRTRP